MNLITLVSKQKMNVHETLLILQASACWMCGLTHMLILILVKFLSLGIVVIPPPV